MKTLIFLVLTSIVFTPKAHALFGHAAAERQARLQAEQQLTEQQHLTAQGQRITHRWQAIAFIAGAGSVVTLIIGTAIGSKGRHDATCQG